MVLSSLRKGSPLWAALSRPLQVRMPYHGGTRRQSKSRLYIICSGNHPALELEGRPVCMLGGWLLQPLPTILLRRYSSINPEKDDFEFVALLRRGTLYNNIFLYCFIAGISPD
jgi:hypothetical protein